MLHAVFCIAGIFLNPFFHTLHLLLIFNISSTAMYILEASTSRLGALTQTFVVAIFFIYSYSTLSAYYYSEKTGDNIGIDVCRTLSSCFMYSLSIGLRYSIADMMNPYNSEDNKFVLKVFFDLSFYILVNTIIVNIVFGIIVDTFGSMRDEEFSRKEMMQSTCLICSNSKKDIQESQQVFKYHIKYHHNIWDYVYFFSYILSKRQIDLTTIQAEAYDNVIQFRNDWLPYQKSLYLKKLNLD